MKQVKPRIAAEVATALKAERFCAQLLAWCIVDGDAATDDVMELAKHYRRGGAKALIRHIKPRNNPNWPSYP